MLAGCGWRLISETSVRPQGQQTVAAAATAAAEAEDIFFPHPSRPFGVHGQLDVCQPESQKHSHRHKHEQQPVSKSKSMAT